MTFVTYPRVQRAEDGSPQDVMLNPRLVAAVFASDTAAGATVIRLATTPGYLIAVPFEEVRQDFPHLVSLSRPATESFSGEDELPNPVTTPILINPLLIASIAQSAQEQGVVIVKMPDGRGLKVAGTFNEVRAKLGLTESSPSLNDEGTGGLLLQ